MFSLNKGIDYMTFQKATSWEERGFQIQKVKDKCNYIIGCLNLPKDDARSLGIIHVRQFCNTLGFAAIKIQQKAEIKKYLPILIDLLDVRNIKDLKAFLHDLNPNFKTSFVTMVQFALENCIERVLDSLPGKCGLNNFSRTSRCLIIDTLKLKNPIQKYELIMVPAWIRNTLHAGGIHKKPDKTVIINGEPYIFKKNQRFECASWSHIFHAFLHSLDVYEEILCSKQVKAIQRIEPE